MHDCVKYDPIQGQGHKPFNSKLEIFPFSKTVSWHQCDFCFDLFFRVSFCFKNTF